MKVRTLLNKLRRYFAGFLILTPCLALHAAPIDLNTWTAESYSTVSGFGSGNWTGSGSGDSVTQSVNGQPTLFYSDFNAFGTMVEGQITVSGGDDDFIGFVLGFQPNDTTNSMADYLLVDWKGDDQFYDFGSPSNTPGTTANRGLAVSRVTGIPTADEFWGHTDFGSDTGGGLTELARGNTLGATGWTQGVDYTFTFDFGPNDLQVFVNGTLELDITGNFSDGSIGFYNFSQAGVTYSAFEKDTGIYPVSVPEPSTLSLMILAFASLGFARPRRWI